MLYSIQITKWLTAGCLLILKIFNLPDSDHQIHPQLLLGVLSALSVPPLSKVSSAYTQTITQTAHVIPCLRNHLALERTDGGEYLLHCQHQLLLRGNNTPQPEKCTVPIAQSKHFRVCVHVGASNLWWRRFREENGAKAQEGPWVLYLVWKVTVPLGQNGQLVNLGGWQGWGRGVCRAEGAAGPNGAQIGKPPSPHQKQYCQERIPLLGSLGSSGSSIFWYCLHL